MGRYAHPDDFFRLAEQFTERELTALLGVDKRTIRRWRRRRSRIPWACYQLALERSSYGLSERDAMEGFERGNLVKLNEALARQVDSLKSEMVRQSRLITWGAANDPFVWPTDPRSALK